MKWEFVWFSDHLSASLIYRSGNHCWTLRPVTLNSHNSCVVPSKNSVLAGFAPDLRIG